MTERHTIYARRRLLRAAERGWTGLERFVDRLAAAGPKIASYNPFYHLGTLAIFLLIVLTVTGIYLTVFYRPGADRAYQSVLGISASWLGLGMRTVHRYGADVLVVVVLLHALKTLLSDRFWGSRWLAWLSGWVMLLIIWSMGLTGYWLVWDAGAQWLTEHFLAIIRGPFAHSLLGMDIGSSTYTLFVIILFLHVFIPPLILAGVLIHALRLVRTRYWTPRWLMAAATVALVALAVVRPLGMAAPADLNRLVTAVELDWLYMGFLPLAGRLGTPLFWALAGLLLLLLAALPWLAPGRHDGPALVLPANCTGCAVCARECPYDAIEMAQRDDESPYNSLAVVTPSHCTGCGICVGACPDDAIELDRLHSAIVRQDLRRTLARVQGGAASDGAGAIVTVYVCDRHAALGTLPPLENPRPLAAAGPDAAGVIPLLQAKAPPRVNVGSWPGGGERVITAVVPCTGMLHPNWVAETVEVGGGAAIVVSCPRHDCGHREGPHWIADRLKRRRTFRRGNTHFLELAPGSRRELLDVWAEAVAGEEPAEARATAVGAAGREAAAGRPFWPGQLRYWGAGLVLLLAVFFVSILFERPATNPLPETGQLRIVINHGGQLIAEAKQLPPELAAKVPANVDPATVLGGERFPVGLRIVVDGETILEERYRPRGLRREGAIYAQEALWLAPGSYEVAIWLMDDDVDWQPVFDGRLVIEEEGVSTLLFDEPSGQFVVR